MNWSSKRVGGRTSDFDEPRLSLWRWARYVAEVGNHLASETQATMSPYGIMLPANGPLAAMRFMFPQMFQRACEIIQIIGANESRSF